MYESTDDPYCYPGTLVLKNVPNLRTQAELEKFEAVASMKRSREPLPSGELDYAYYRRLHRHLFQDVYQWAGKTRTVRITKGNSTFCYPEHVANEMTKLFGWLEGENYLRDLDSESFATKAAHLLAELNAIHPFREGNGRTQNTFLYVLADRAGHPLDFDRLEPSDLKEATIASFENGEGQLAELILSLMRVP
jgi:cell filamentation protein